MRKSFVEPEIIEQELASTVAECGDIDYITFSGSGEPTLSLDLGRLIHFAKSLDAAPVCVLTNGTMLSEPEVRKELASADLAVPNLDAADEETFHKVNRTHKDIAFDSYIAGLKDFSTEFAGNLHLEIMLVEGINDDTTHLQKLSDLVEQIAPDGVWVGTVTRPSAEKFARPVSQEKLEEAKRIIGEKARIIEKYDRGPIPVHHEDIINKVEQLLRRRPEKAESIAESLGANPHEIIKAISFLVSESRVKKRRMGNEIYYEIM